MPPDPRVHVGVCAVVHHEQTNDLLMVQRGGTGEYAGDGHGTWSVPGGWLDFGESPSTAAVRETLEESGVKVKSHREMGFVSAYSEVKEIQIVTLFVACLHVSGQPTVVEPDKCPAVEWVPMIEVPMRDLFAPLNAWISKGREL